MSNVITPKEGEKVLLNLRKNVFTYIRQMLIVTAILGIAILMITFLYENTVAIYVAGTLFIFALGYLFYYFLIWFYDVYIITNMRIVSVTKKNLFHREYCEVSYTDVTDVTYLVKGVFATLFGYGCVTVSGPSTLVLTNVSEPGEILETLKALVQATKQKSH